MECRLWVCSLCTVPVTQLLLWWCKRLGYKEVLLCSKSWVENRWNTSHTRSPFYYQGLTSIPAWISNHMSSKVWDKINYPFLNFNGCTVEVWEWVNNFIPHLIMDVIIYPCQDLSSSMLLKGAPGSYSYFTSAYQHRNILSLACRKNVP